MMTACTQGQATTVYSGVGGDTVLGQDGDDLIYGEGGDDSAVGMVFTMAVTARTP